MMRAARSLITILLLPALAACGEAPAPEPESDTRPTAEPRAEAERPEPTEPGVVEIVAEEYSFTAPPTFPSGWVTLRFHNRGDEIHFVTLYELPEGVTFGDYTGQLARPFNDYYALYRAGELDRAGLFEELGAAIPEWFHSMRRAGGAGFTSPGRTSETTVHLEPGEYVMECYVRARDEGDTFHGSHGMLRPLIVTEERSPLAEPAADVGIELSSYAIEVDGPLTAGSHVARVAVEEDPEGLIFHNVHLARLDEGQDPVEVAAWMDWVDALLPPAPAEFLGGAGQLSAVAESYLHFELEPGRYAWISETHGAAQGMLREFVVE